jgi:hypothetical protein
MAPVAEATWPRPAAGRDELVELIDRLGRENRSWGCVRIKGELRKLGIRISATSIRRVLRRAGPLHGVAPRGPSSFVSRLTACWPRTSSPWTRWRLKQLYVLFVIELSSREAHILGVTVHPKGAFVTQVARNLMGDLADRDRSVKFLIGPGH